MAGPAKLYSFHKKCLAKPGDFFVKSGIFGETPFTSLVNCVHAFVNKGVRFHWLKRKLERKKHGFFYHQIWRNPVVFPANPSANRGVGEPLVIKHG